MYLRPFAAAVAGAAIYATGASAECNPMHQDNCPPNPAFGPGVHTFDFTTATSLESMAPMFEWDRGARLYPQIVQYDRARGTRLLIHSEPHAPTFWTPKYFFFGRVEVEMKFAPGQGIITAITLQSDAKDEIDFEFVGNHRHAIETNLYSKGVNDHTRYLNITTPYDPSQATHVYAIEWTAAAITYFIDGAPVRTAVPADFGAEANVKWPQTPCQLRIGTWLGGGASMQATQPGTVVWAGGPIQWAQAPFEAVVKRVTIIDYANGKPNAKQYTYTDRSASMGSVKVT